MTDKILEATVSLRNNKIRAARLRLGLSQKQFASMLGLSCSVVNRAECLDFRFVNSLSRKKIADFLGLEVEEVFPPWLLLIKKNKIVKQIEAEEIPLLSNHLDQVLGYLPENPEDLLLKKERLAFCVSVLNYLKKVSPRKARIFQDYVLKGKTQAELSIIHGISRSRVHQIIQQCEQRSLYIVRERWCEKLEDAK